MTDQDVAGRVRPQHLQPVLILVVALGGAIGTGARYSLTVLLPAQDGLPIATLIANLSGAFLLGVLLEALARALPETRGRRIMRLGLGTGVLGGFTTYSALALEVHDLFSEQNHALAVGYGVGSVVLGVLACLLGVLLSAAGVRCRVALMPQDPDDEDLQPPSLPTARDR